MTFEWIHPYLHILNLLHFAVRRDVIVRSFLLQKRGGMKQVRSNKDASEVIDVREIFCQGRQSTILRPNVILDRIFINVFVLVAFCNDFFLKMLLFGQRPR